MRRHILNWMLLAIFQPIFVFGQYVDTTEPGVLAIAPVEGSIYLPVFSPFCSDIVWLGKRAFELSTRQFLASEATMDCIPKAARETHFSEAPNYPSRTRGEADPYFQEFYWAFGYQRDSFLVWRYDLLHKRLDQFLSVPTGRVGIEHVVTQAGILLSGDQGLTLYDRHSAAVLQRIGTPDPNYILRLRRWGNDVLVTDRWLYRVAQNRYEDFFPLPDDLKGCKSPINVEFFGEACITGTVDNGAPVDYIIAAGYKPVRLPFKHHWSSRRNDLAVNPPKAWFSFPDKLIAFDFSTGDSSVYLFKNGEPLIGDQSGPFLGFHSEKGMSFFDKNSGRFRVLNKPFGFKLPSNFLSDQRFLYLTYDEHWELIDFSKLDTAFRHSPVLEEYAAFSKEATAFQESHSGSFFAQYEAFEGLIEKYKALQNPKIEAEWERLALMLHSTLYQEPPAVWEQVGSDYLAGRFAPELSCGIVTALFEHWSQKNELELALQLLEIPGNEACIEAHGNYGSYFIQLLRSTKSRIDSVASLEIPPDQRLYAMGRVWWDYCSIQAAVDYNGFNLLRLERPISIFRSLLTAYPDSPWADNAAYDTLHYIDYQPQTTDDFTPPGNDNLAYQAFTRFLRDYPSSDRRPDVLVRLANVIQRGVSDSDLKNISKEDAADYLHLVATEYPDFAKNSKAYKESVARQNKYQWSNRWTVTFTFNAEKYQMGDSILVTVQLQNRSGSAKTLEPNFLLSWHKGLKLQLSKVVEAGCEGLWGDFPLLPIGSLDSVQVVRVEPRAYYSQTFVLQPKSVTKRFYPGTFDLERGAAYDYQLEFRHEQFSWLWVEAKNRGRIQIE